MANQRFHDMDFCRAIFMYCGILFHCGLIYGAGQDWRVVSDQTSTLLSLISNFLHHFRMEAFYLVSGFFYLLIFAKGRKNFLNDRVLRALIPMLVVGLTLNFAMNLLSNNRTYQINIDYFLTGKWQAHLWFLGNLTVYFFLALPIAKTLAKHSKKTTSQGLLNKMLWLLTLALIGHFAAQYLSLTTVVFINFGYLFYYFPFFLMGVFAFHQKNEFYRLIQLRYFAIFLVLYAVLQALVLLNPDWPATLKQLLKQASHFPLMLAAFSALCFVGKRQSKLIRFLSDASYTIYLFHQPLLIVIYVFGFAHLQLGAITEYLLLIAVVFIISSLIHVYVVKRFTLSQFLLNGVVTRPK